MPSNKGMKLTKPERNGALQLIPGVRPTGLRRQGRLTDNGLPATDFGLEGCETRSGEARERATDRRPVGYGPPAWRPEIEAVVRACIKSYGLPA
jgi:hypothetical protein